MSASRDTSSWAPGTQYWTQVTDQNKAGLLYVITLLSLVYIIIVFCVRFLVKMGMYGRDDWSLLAATVFAIGQHIAILAGLSNGLGKSVFLLADGELGAIEEFTAAHMFLFILSHCTSKLSIALLTQRLFENGRNRNVILCWTVIGITIFYGVWSILVLAVDCPQPAFSVNTVDACPSRFLRIQLMTAVDIASEFVIVIVPALLVLDVQMKLQAKALVVGIFAVRLPVVAFSALNLNAESKARNQTDVGLALVAPLIFTQAELIWSIIAASVPCLKTFMSPFDKINDTEWLSGNMYASQHSYVSNSAGGTRVLDINTAMNRRNNRDVVNKAPLAMEEALGGKMRADNVGHQATVRHPSSHEEGSLEEGISRPSFGSQERIIKKQTQWEVRHESAPRDPYEIV